MDVTPTDRQAGASARIPPQRRPSRKPPRPVDLTLNMLAQRRSTHLLRNRTFTRASSSRAVSGLLVVPVRSVRTPTGPRWLLAPPDTASTTPPSWSAHEPAITEFDHALRVDLLLRLIPTGPLPGVSGDRHLAGGIPRSTPAAAPAWPVALLLERRGPCVVDDGDIAWWQSFVHACGIVGRIPAASLVVCATGIRDVAAGRTTDPA